MASQNLLKIWTKSIGRKRKMGEEGRCKACGEWSEDVDSDGGLCEACTWESKSNE